MIASNTPGAGISEADTNQESLTETLSALQTAFAASVDKSLRLLLLESRMAALSLSTMLFLAVVAALLITSAWMFILAATALWLVGLGLVWELALLLSAGINILLIFPLMHSIRRLSRRLLFNASRRRLRQSLSGT